MDDLAEIVIYPLQRIAALIFSMEIADGVSIGALLVAAALLCILFRALVGIHFGFIGREREQLPEERAEHLDNLRRQRYGDAYANQYNTKHKG